MKLNGSRPSSINKQGGAEVAATRWSRSLVKILPVVCTTRLLLSPSLPGGAPQDLLNISCTTCSNLDVLLGSASWQEEIIVHRDTEDDDDYNESEEEESGEEEDDDYDDDSEDSDDAAVAVRVV